LITMIMPDRSRVTVVVPGSVEPFLQMKHLMIFSRINQSFFIGGSLIYLSPLSNFWGICDGRRLSRSRHR